MHFVLVANMPVHGTQTYLLYHPLRHKGTPYAYIVSVFINVGVGKVPELTPFLSAGCGVTDPDQMLRHACFSKVGDNFKKSTSKSCEDAQLVMKNGFLYQIGPYLTQ